MPVPDERDAFRAIYKLTKQLMDNGWPREKAERKAKEVALAHLRKARGE